MTANASFQLTQYSGDPGASPAGTVYLYAKTDGSLCIENSSGVVTAFGIPTPPAGGLANIQYNNNGVFGAIADGIYGQVLTSQGSGGVPIWAAASIPPAGSNYQVQFNSSGSFSASAAFTYSPNTLTLGDGTNIELTKLLLQADGGNTAFIAIAGSDQPYPGALYITAPKGIWLDSYGPGTAGQYLTSQGTGAEPSWTTPTPAIYKQMITTTGNDTIGNSTSPTIYAVLLGAQATESLTFPTADFDGQVLAINAADAQTALTMTPAGADTIKNPLTTIGAGQSVTFIYNLATTTWY